MNQNVSINQAAVPARIAYQEVPPEIYAALRHVEETVRNCGLDKSLVQLIKIRASLMNGCAYCLDMHMKEALAAGHDLQRLYSLNLWHETPFFSAQERAVLAWTEAVTLPQQGGIADAVYDALSIHFDKSDIAKLTLAIVAINSWNRFILAIRTPPGSYKVANKIAA